MIGTVTMQAMASKKGAMRALGRVVRNDEAANEVVAAGGLVPIIALLECNDAGVVRRSCPVPCHLLSPAWQADSNYQFMQSVRVTFFEQKLRLCTYVTTSRHAKDPSG